MTRIGTGNPRVVVCETKSRWARLIRRGLAADRAAVVEVRNLIQAERLLREHPASVLLIEFAASRVPETVRALLDFGERFPHATMLVAGSRQAARCADVLREAGARFVFVSTRQITICLRMIRRHLAEVPQTRLPFRQAVWARLPWPES
jgi:hypothetical protein